ncbi:hypothetical protein CPT03_03265 [Pedobacter ginsengisoli]|uniref:Uncharacterized protein n=1 Tax=Pedobacter ginsengisoli TaxID=363852 RepID=A0A2D1U1R5_9SPHI|nr:hypothetical protein CPT03_03265 [Pedobacter ginsengisoli]
MKLIKKQTILKLSEYPPHLQTCLDQNNDYTDFNPDFLFLNQASTLIGTKEKNTYSIKAFLPTKK